MIDRGQGTPIVLVPGVQGRWEWMAATVDALAERCRVITFSLADEPTSGFDGDTSSEFGMYVTQIGDALNRARLDRAVIVGVSFSGLAAVEFAERAPWMALFPGLAISLSVFAFNVFGDSLRDALDPKLRLP